MVFDDDEAEDTISDILRVVPKQYQDYKDVFSKARAERLPPHRSYDLKIDLIKGSTLPKPGKIFGMSEKHNLALEQEIRELLRKGFIRASHSKIGASIFPVPKQDQTLWWVIDYRGLNEISKKNAYPLPVISHLLNQLRTGKIFSKIDLRGAYNLLRVREGDK